MMRRLGLTILCAIAAGLSGCVTPPQFSLDTWRQAQSHVFRNTSVQQFEAALREAFEASRPGEYELRPIDGGAIIEHHWIDYAVLASSTGLEQWTIKYRQEGNDIEAHAELVAMPTGGWPPDTDGIERPDNPQTYAIMWERIDYILHIAPHWPTCAEYEDARPRGTLDGLRPWGLCGTWAREKRTL